MDRKKIKGIALAAIVVAGGGYFWAQQSAKPVKPPKTGTAATQKPGAPQGTKPAGSQPKKPAAPQTNSPAAPQTTKPTPAAAPTNAGSAPAVPATKSAAATAPAASKSASGVGTKAMTDAARKSTPLEPAVATAAAPMPATPAAASSWQDQLQKGAFLAEKLQPRLPNGTDLQVASNGFRDLQQFVATVNAAHNLGLNFDELKRRVVTDGKGLASAIDAMRKVASATIEEQRAEYEARGLIQESKRHPLPPAPAVKRVSTKEQPKKPIRAQSGL